MNFHPWYSSSLSDLPVTERSVPSLRRKKDSLGCGLGPSPGSGGLK